MFIQILQAHCTRQAELHQVIEEASAGLADRAGWLGGTFGFTGDDRFVGVVRFESEEACRELTGTENAQLWLERAQKLCDEPVQVHESADVTMMLEGGSDRAGFVQVMRGRVADAEKLRHLVSDEMASMLHQARPEIVGATLAVEPDGSFTETIAFTDEKSARMGEQQEMPDEVRAEIDSAMADVEFLDLQQPWFASHR